jgi:hypothetical protein
VGLLAAQMKIVVASPGNVQQQNGSKKAVSTRYFSSRVWLKKLRKDPA